MRKFYQIFIISLLLICKSAVSADFSKVDSLISASITDGAFPSAQIIVASKDGVIYSKAFGNLTYEPDSPPATSQTVYDIASLTKVIATTPAIMKLYDTKQIDIYDKVSKYIPEFANNGKEDITIYNLLLHNSGLKAWIPFYKTCRSKEEVLNTIYNIGLDYPTGSSFVYSDLNAVLLGVIVERASGLTFDSFCEAFIFAPLGMRMTHFNPQESPHVKIAPTEQDTYWRKRLLQGEVHDETAAMLNGVSGNAGVFSNARDIFTLVSTIANKGVYTNPDSRALIFEKFCSEYTTELFTNLVTGLPYENTRALGWDTKPQATSYPPPCGYLMSSNCFGHTGFTGTSAWYDKDRDVTIILLTNRVYPTRDNNKIRNVRPAIHDAVFEAILKS